MSMLTQEGAAINLSLFVLFVLSLSCTEAFQLAGLVAQPSFSSRPDFGASNHHRLGTFGECPLDQAKCAQVYLRPGNRVERSTVTTQMAESRGEYDGDIAEEMSILVMRKRLHDRWLQGRLKAKTIHLPFKEAVKWARAMGRWDSEDEWWEWINMGEGKNPYIPSNPEKYYGERGEWKGWDHWLGVNKYAPKKRSAEERRCEEEEERRRGEEEEESKPQ